MREYAKLAPTFWTGTTGRSIRRRGSEAVIVALYLVSSPHSNMLGLYYQPLMYMAHETGLGIEGASKGLKDCIECSFCSYDEDTEMVFVHEMAAWQVAEALTSGDKRCKGIQKDYEALPECTFLEAWFDRYVKAFHLTERRTNPVVKPEVWQGAYQAPPKPHRSQEQEQEQEQDPSEALRAPQGSGAEAPAAVAAPPPDSEAKPLTDRERVWALGVPLLGEAGRGLLGKLAKAHGESVLASVLAEATLEKPLEPKAWLISACEARAKAPKNGHSHEPEDLLADPYPSWALNAGFPDRFQAENAGCLPYNAAKFSGGKRVSA